MIIAIITEVNIMTQDVYDQISDRIDPAQLECPCCGHTGTTVHGYYERKLKTPAGKITLLIKRIRCSFCGKTHAILPSTIVPYSQISMKDTVAFITARTPAEREKVMKETPEIDESDMYRILGSYKRHWKERLASHGLAIDSGLPEKCIRIFRRQFMQIPCTVCGSHGCNHIIQQDIGLSFP